ncbi:hypothetical protein NQ317_004927 [Molorchus minor]|uniref:Uncharacterized protein n=1 Tax=Molorchus minor TaxID=1323400 RepID=A0ABQ9JV24_9CUCU|nr:hypothetical protein NQ317_004927 [Molorchus minor]
MNLMRKKRENENQFILKEAGTDDSLTLSITPPIPEDNKKDNDRSYESISEHLTSNSESVENDRSYQEIEISNRPLTVLFNLNASDEEQQHNISQEPRPHSLETSFCTENSIISLNYLDRIHKQNMEVDNNVRSILEEILNNEQFEAVSAAPSLSDNSKQESLNIFENVDLDDKSLTNFRMCDESLNEKNLFASNFGVLLDRRGSDIDKRIKDFEELIAIKDSTIAALTSEVDSFREMSNTNSTSMVSVTEYKQLQEECHNKLLEYNDAIIYKNDLIQQLSESLDQSIGERKELLKQVDCFKDEIDLLQKQLQETAKMVNEHKCLEKIENKEKDVPVGPKETEEPQKDLGEEKTEISFLSTSSELSYSDLEENLTSEQKNLFDDLKIKLNEFVKRCINKNKTAWEEEISKLKEKNIMESKDYEMEITRLRDLLANIKCGSAEIMELKNELEAKHSNEMEELRTYFEKKCADLEKNYSEEIFSQHSRKMSGSTCSEAELNSDPFSHSPGPDGDIRLHLEPNLTKKDISNLKNELSSILTKVGKYNLDSITEEDFARLKSEIGKCNLNNLLKYDLTIIRNELQNKYHAELEVLREDNENRIDVLNVEHEARIKSLENKYVEEIEQLKCRLDEMGMQQMSISSAVQEVASSSGEFEITEVIQSYERRLQEQVTLAKIDIISALESQIQRLAANDSDDEEWPFELLQLRDRFTDKYENEIRQMRDDHQNEIERLKEEHIKILNGALDRARRRSLRDSDSLNKGDLEILKERDNLKKQVSSLRHLLGELLKYFTQCEDELNNTLVEELLKQGFDKSMSQIEDDLNLNDSSTTNSSKTGDSTTNITRVHLTPNFSDLINLIETNSQEDCDSKDISVDLKNELGKKKLKEDLNEALSYVESLEKEKERLEKELDENYRQKITCWKKNGMKEVVIV